MNSIAELPVGAELLWFLGDNFVAKSYQAHYKLCQPPNGEKHFIKECYEFTAQCGSKWSSSNENMLSRIRSAFVNAVSHQKSGILPRYVVIILDEDLISYLNFRNEGIATLLGTWVDWLSTELVKIVDERHQQVPAKCRPYRPFFYWVNAPTHAYFSKEKNALRVKFNLSLESMVRNRKDMRVVKIKDGWNYNDSLLILNDRITEPGLTAYWNGVDSTMKFNILRRELYVTKTLTQSHQQQESAKDDRQPRLCTSEQPLPNGSSTDPMRSFFRRNSYNVEREMHAREDFAGRRQ